MFPTDTRILVVDDMLTMRKLVAKTLKELGYTDIQDAKDGVDALEKLNSAHAAGKPFGLVISDWNMPNMKGIELLEKVKASAELRGVPFIILTAESEKSQVSEALKLGAAEFISKPFTKESIEEKLKAVAGGTQMKKAG